jgi:hypothetical protein
MHSSVQHTLLKIAFVAGPILLFLSAMSFVLGIGILPPGISSWVEGLFGSYALMLFVPIYLFLAAKLSETNRTLGAVATITGLCGAVTGFSLELLRVIEFGLRQHGAGDAVFQSYYANPGWEFLIVALLGPLFPITSIILGVGFLKSKILPVWSAIGLVVAGIFFPLAQVLEWEWGFKVTYPLACMIWGIVLPYIGLYHVRPKTSDTED